MFERAPAVPGGAFKMDAPFVGSDSDLSAFEFFAAEDADSPLSEIIPNELLVVLA